MELELEKYKVYLYIKSRKLPQVVIDEFKDDIETNQNYNQFRNLVLSELEDFFSIVAEIYNTPNKSTFKTKGYFDQYRTKSIEILEQKYELLDSFRVDEIILNLLTTNEQYDRLVSQRRACALEIHEFFFELLFSDHYNTLTKASTVNEIDKVILEAKHAKSRVLLKYDPDYIPTEKIRQLVAEKISALIEHANNMKEFLDATSLATKEMKTSDVSSFRDVQRSSVEKRETELAFDDLFNKPFDNYISEFINILREVTPELINTEGHWIGAKNAARIYVNALKSNGIINSKTTEREAHAALGNKFPNLGTSFMKNQRKGTKADVEYEDMDERVSALKSTIQAKLR